MNIYTDHRIVLTLDAGGTNFRFNAIQAGEELYEPITIKAKSDSLERVLINILHGFEEVKKKLAADPVAISFCFPGPADYPRGIIGDLQNLPHFRGGVALKDMLEDHFRIPVFINNDGDLFTYGEAIGGLLPEINRNLEQAGNPKRYKNLFGVTFGTGFGGGMVSGATLHMGDNSSGGEINRMRNKLYPGTSVEDSTSIRAIRRVYAREAGIDPESSPNPKEIYDIAHGQLPGNIRAAKIAYEELGTAAGDAIANAITLFDGLVVLGGGLSKAYPLFIQRLVDEMNEKFKTLAGEPLDRMEVFALNLESETGLAEFVRNRSVEIPVPFSNRKVIYDPSRYVGVGVSRLSTSRAVSVGAYAYALNHLR